MMSNVSGHSRQWRVAALAALVLVLGAYSNTLRNSFHFDDSHVIEGNLYIRSLSNLKTMLTDANAFSSLPANATYRPLVTVSLAVDYWLGGGSVVPFHVSQITMLVVLAAMLYGMFLAVMRAAPSSIDPRYPALLGATLFAVHTVNTETLNLISARSELLSAMGVVGAFLVYLYFPASRRWHLYLVPMVVGTLAKTPAVIFAALFPAYLFLFEARLPLDALFSRGTRSEALGVLRRASPGLVVGLASYALVEIQNSSAATYGGGSPFHYLLTQMFVWLHYARLFVLPLGLTADTDWGLIPHWYDTRVIAGAAFIAGLVWAIGRASRAELTRPVAFGLAWFCLALLPGSSIVPLAEVSNEHRVFLPYVGLALATAWVLLGVAPLLAASRGWGLTARALLPIGAVLILLANAAGAHARNAVWLDEETLWRDVTEKSPGNGRGLMNYGLTQMAKGRYVEARDLFERAATLNPNYPTLEINRGVVSAALGDHAAAEGHFKRALALQPDAPNSHVFLARWLIDRGRLSEALPHLERAIALSPGRLDARHMLMDAYARSGRSDDAKALAQRTLALVPDDRTADLVSRGGVPVTAATSTAPSGDSQAGMLELSLQQYRAGKYEDCIATARRIIERWPDLAAAHNNVAAAAAALGRWDEAIAAARQALTLQPDFALARNNLAWAEAEKRKAGAGR